VVPITVPYSASQISLYEKVSKLANINPWEVSYVEAHGTGTPVGDPIECESIRQVFGSPKRKSVLHLGSIKANIGHTESTSGVAGLIKVLLMMQHREIPPQANFVSLNSKIRPLETDHMAISQSSKEWNDQFLAACVNNYGAAGSNAAMIVCQAPSSGASHNVPLAIKSLQDTQDTRYPIYISAHSAQSLTSYCHKLLEEVNKIDKKPQKQAILSSLAFNLSRKKNRSHNYLFTTVVSSLPELRKRLEEALSATTPFYTQVKTKPLPVVLVFGGQIGNSVGLPLEIYKSSSRLRYHLESCDASLRRLGYPTLFPGIFERESIEDVVSLHSMLFAVQYSFAKTWMDCGLKIDAILGHSFGQLTALCVCGSLSLEQGLKLVAGRATLMKSHWGPERGSMISLEAPRECISKIVEITNQQGSNYKVEVACYNGPYSHVLVGSHDSINYVEELVTSKQESLQVTKWKKLSVPYGFHSRFTEPLLPELLNLARSLDFTKPSVSLETCSNQQSWNEITADLVADHTRSPVHFDQAVDRLSKQLGSCTWVEAGMNSSVTSMIRHILSQSQDSEDNYHPINIGASDALGSLAKASIQLWNHSQIVHFWPFHHTQAHQYDFIDLPAYQFEKTRHWIEWIDHANSSTLPLVTRPKQIEPAVFMSIVEKKYSKTRFRFDPRFDQYRLFVQGHRVLDQPLCPAPLYFELATRAIQSLLDDPSQTLISLETLEIKAPLGLATDRFLYLTLEQVPGAHHSWSFEFSSESREDEKPTSSQHASGKVILQNPEATSLINEFQRYERLISLDRTQFLSNDPDTESIQGSLIYKVFEKVVHYDPYYKGVRRVFAKGHEITGQVRLTKNENENFQTTSTNPLLIDNFIQVSGLHVNSLYDCGEDDVYVCTKVDRVQPTPEFKNLNSTTQSWTVYSSFSILSEREVINDIFVFDNSSKALVTYMLGARFTRVAMRSLAKVLATANLPYSSRKSSTSSQVTTIPTSRTFSDHSAPIPVPTEVIETAAATTSQNFSIAVRSFLARVIDIDIKEITDDSTPDDLGIDSLMITELLSEIQTVFGITIPMDDFVTLTTVKKLQDYIQSKVKKDFQHNVPSSSFDVDSPDISSDSDSEGETTATSATGSITPDDVQVKLMNLLQSHLEIDTVINLKDNLADCGLDSLICMELVSDIEKEFGRRIDPTLLTNDSNFGDLYHLVFPNHSVREEVYTQKHEVSAIETVSQVNFTQSSQSNSKFSSLDFAQQHFRDISRDYDKYAAKTGFSNFWSTTYPAQARLVAAYTVEAFSSLGCSLTSLKAGSRLPDVQVLQKHDLLLAQLYRILESESLIEIRGEEKIRTSKTVDQTHSSMLLERILRDFPQHASEHKLLDITGSKLADCLTGAADPLMLLFRPAANRALLEDVYTNGPMYEAVTKQLGSYFEKAFGRPSDGQVFDVLELGGGTGGTTKYIIDLLSRLNIPIRYTFTDISSSLVAAARRKFAGKDFMQFKVLNIEKEPPEIELDRYHAILSTNCIHATTDLTVSGTNMRKMLRQDGFIALVEFTRNMFWFDLVFGLLDGWWFYKDGRDHVLADEYFWERSLRSAGFKHVAWTGADTEESNTLRIITAYQKPATILSQSTNIASSDQSATEETLLYKQVGSTSLFADIYYPSSLAASAKKRPVGAAL
jgi:acyl carrier protein